VRRLVASKAPTRRRDLEAPGVEMWVHPVSHEPGRRASDLGRDTAELVRTIDVLTNEPAMKEVSK
jgi:hypothetical protein